ncbi:MAG: cobaltochelatase subunit CobN, partial [Pseudomonadota bacterium]
SIAAIVSLQNFVLGGGPGREQVIQSLEALNVPVLKGIRLTNSTADAFQVSEEGIRSDSVHYRVAMPELQGISQPLVAAALGEAKQDKLTGLKYSISVPIDAQVSLLANRVLRHVALQSKANKDKRIAIVYYNHPPGRHNIGADNLNVPTSLFEILNQLKSKGYATGELPASSEELLDMLQERGVNLPEDRSALEAIAQKVTNIPANTYQSWFETLPNLVQEEMQDGPLGYLKNSLQIAVNLDDKSTGKRMALRVIEDLKHALEGTDHKARDRAIDLLAQLEDVYTKDDDLNIDWQQAEQLTEAIVAAQIEGIRGWGAPPGKIMVHDNAILLPGLRFGNVFVGPQPPRGWELSEEVLHANLSFPPPHQYMAFYQWLQKDFKADAIVHLGRHSTYEFLPRHRVGMSEVDYPTSLIGDIPSIYPYIVDGVGEGIQAKRRGLAVIVDHLTPPLDSTDLYDELLTLRQLIESYEAAPVEATSMRKRAVDEIKRIVAELKLEDELTEIMEGELAVRGLTAYEQVDDELLVHEVGHYLTKLQEDFMPLGLHTFGKEWTQEAVDTMVGSMQQGLSETELKQWQEQGWQEKLSNSPKAETMALLNGLAGGFISPAKGNDPIRTAEVLPTGRNFFALDGGLIPTKLGHQTGVELAQKARSQTNHTDNDAVVLWASDVVRDEGAMIAFGFDMLGVKPVWSSRGIVKGLTRIDISDMQENGQPRVRRDTLFTTSGLFRDLYGKHILLLEQAVLMALDASSERIKQDYPALSLSLDTTLAALSGERNAGSEPFDINLVAAQWVADAQQGLQQGLTAADAGKQASYRIFGDAPGTYGAGVNRMVERSGSWQDRSEIADVYIKRIGHAYGSDVQGQPLQAVFSNRLNLVDNTYLGRSSNLYGLLDNNDTFDYLGGLSLAVEMARGQVPSSFILAHEDTRQVSVEPLSLALLGELRGRFLNPQWLQPLMDEGYAGARTMGSEFMEYLWGWQVTNPDIVKSWVWDEVKSVYVDDKHEIGLDEFLEDNHNVHVKANMLAIMLVAAQKEFWQADDTTLEEISQQFAQLIAANGLPGSGHTSPSNPIFDFIEDYVPQELYAQVQERISAAKIESTAVDTPSSISELELDSAADQSSPDESSENSSVLPNVNYYWLFLIIVLLFIVGIYRGTRVNKS